MKTYKTIPPEVAALIPPAQLQITKRNIKEFQSGIENLEIALSKCPKPYQTDGMKEHPAIFHYFLGSTDIFICEFDREDRMFGYGILSGDLKNSEWGYFSLTSLKKSIHLNIDYHFEEQTIEAALYEAYPKYFKEPLSLKNIFITEVKI